MASLWYCGPIHCVNGPFVSVCCVRIVVFSGHLIILILQSNVNNVIIYISYILQSNNTVYHETIARVKACGKREFIEIVFQKLRMYIALASAGVCVKFLHKEMFAHAPQNTQLQSFETRNISWYTVNFVSSAISLYI